MCVYNVCVYANVYLKWYAMFYAIILEFLSISVLFSYTFFLILQIKLLLIKAT